MSNDSQKRQIARNKQLRNIWLIIAFVFTSISAFAIFLLRRDEPKKQNVSTFWAGFTTTFIGFVLMFRSIRVFYDKEKHAYYTKGNLDSKNGSYLTDMIGIGCIVMFVGIWWDHAAWLLILIPIFIVISFIKKLLAWLKY